MPFSLNIFIVKIPDRWNGSIDYDPYQQLPVGFLFKKCQGVKILIGNLKVEIFMYILLK